MNKTPSETVKLIEELKPLVKNDEVDVVFCVPAISLTTALEAAKGSNIEIGAENMFYEDEIYAKFLADMRRLLKDDKAFKDRYCKVNNIQNRNNKVADEVGYREESAGFFMQ